MKKILSTLIALCLLATPGVNAAIYENTETRTVVSGVTHTYRETFAENGWVKTNVLEIDLNDKDLDLTALFSTKGISFLGSIPSNATEGEVVAAINGDFFNWYSEMPGRSTPLGLTAENGEIVSSPSHDTGLAALIENDDGELFADYFQMKLELVAQNNNRCRILHINKFHPMESVVMYTSAWGETTPGSHNNVIEMVVEDGVVTEIREEMDGAVVPENGYVLATSKNINLFFLENFQVGDKAEIECTITPDYGNIQTAVGGGTILVSEGKIANFSHVISGSHPRTAAGIDKSGKVLYMVTVDGRQTATAGMTQTELAEYMISLGAYTAINFDGGGSSTMVVRSEYGENKVVNTLSDGSARSVATGLGIRYTGEVGDFAILEAEASEDKIFMGEGTIICLYAYDENYNPVYIADREIEYLSDSGYFKENVFYPEKAGKNTFTVSCDGITATGSVFVMPKVNEISKTKKGFSEKALSFSILPAKITEKTFLNYFINDSLETISKSNDIAYSFGEYDTETRVIEDYSYEVLDNNLFLTIDTEGGGIRYCDPSQWYKLLSIEEKNLDNVFVFLTDGNFKDPAEHKLFNETLTTKFLKNGTSVFVITEADKTSFSTVGNIHYLSIPKTPKIRIDKFFEDVDSVRYFHFVVDGEKVFYETLPVLWI